jgi:UDP-N-acetylmuramyl pentapeptide phosphotransferase/UDP-N-acetylglucosamine-1-phosphate transferase
VACISSGIALRGVGIPQLDSCLAYTPVAILFTAFCVAGVSNAINIIDGQNGLASGTAVICLLGIAAIARSAGDDQLALVCVFLSAAVLGFWAVNFPWGRLFLGDGGAYFAGFALAWVAVLLPARNPAISPWASLLVCAYPIIEVIYSVARRARQHRPAVSADCAHLHSLVAQNFVRRHLSLLGPVLQNSAVSVIMWLFAAAPALMAVVFHSQAAPLVLAFATCFVAYHLFYRKVADS